MEVYLLPLGCCRPLPSLETPIASAAQNSLKPAENPAPILPRADHVSCRRLPRLESSVRFIYDKELSKYATFSAYFSCLVLGWPFGFVGLPEAAEAAAAADR